MPAPALGGTSCGICGCALQLLCYSVKSDDQAPKRERALSDRPEIRSVEADVDYKCTVDLRAACKVGLQSRHVPPAGVVDLQTGYTLQRRIAESHRHPATHY